jgi:hypothetical protein
MDNCECLTWARTFGPMLTDHHPMCSRYDPSGDAVRLIRALTDAMREWGAWEDGIPEKFWPAYQEACDRLGQPAASPADVGEGGG